MILNLKNIILELENKFYEFKNILKILILLIFDFLKFYFDFKIFRTPVKI